MQVKNFPENFTLINQECQSDINLGDFIHQITNLSKSRIKDALEKGAVWVQKKNSKKKRVRKFRFALSAGDRFSLYYNKSILDLTCTDPLLIHDYKDYSIWSKPAGVLSQGTKYSDHCSILRLCEKLCKPRRISYPIHRLDREAFGLLLVGHTKKAASVLGALLQERKVKKKYFVKVLGKWLDEPEGSITAPLDNKSACTNYQVVQCDEISTTLIVTLGTGRLHQIRRHFNLVNHPVIGDPRYGKGNKDNTGLKLKAIEISFYCPIVKQKIQHRISDNFAQLD